MVGTLGFPVWDMVVLAGVLLLSVVIDFLGHKEEKEISIKSALKWSAFWIALGFAYYGYIWVVHSKEYASLFLSGYVLEKSLSIDNLLVFMAIFASFGIKSTHLQHKFIAYTQPGTGRIAERHVEGDYVRVPTYRVQSSVDWT